MVSKVEKQTFGDVLNVVASSTTTTTTTAPPPAVSRIISASAGGDGPNGGGVAQHHHHQQPTAAAVAPPPHHPSQTLVNNKQTIIHSGGIVAPQSNNRSRSVSVSSTSPLKSPAKNNCESVNKSATAAAAAAAVVMPPFGRRGSSAATTNGATNATTIPDSTQATSSSLDTATGTVSSPTSGSNGDTSGLSASPSAAANNSPQQQQHASPPPPPPSPLSNKTANATATHNNSTHTTFSSTKNEEFVFIRPPECPVFEPNEDEFKNPLAFISKIRSKAEQYGICKIRPPKSWTPPFTVDVDKLRFTPRVQRLNELEAKTRVKLNFLDQIAKFWELQGSSLKIPMVERKALDLYTLHRVVQEEGGMEQTTKERKWSKVSQRMGYPAGKGVGTILKGHYERILHPFDVFTLGKSLAVAQGAGVGSTTDDSDATGAAAAAADAKTKLEPETDDQDYKPHGIVSRQLIVPPKENTARRSKRFANSSSATCGVSNYNVTHTNSTGVGYHHTTPIKEEIKRESDDGGSTPTTPQRYGKGRPRNSSTNSAVPMGRGRKAKDVDPLAKYICHICNRGDIEEAMLLCDGCDDSYHTFCLIPPLSDIPKGDWRCPKCVVEEVSKPVEAFGFEQAQREYTLQQFGEMADQFKADYFNMSVHLVPTELVEREFWRIVSSIDEDVTVEYGADLHTMDHGSGFPTKSSLYLLPGDQEYAESSWNLNNLPLLEESILGHINADISGMKVPWMYVGMCFATFCWHNEDHWSYSINYLHWGEPKTWYGVPGYKAEVFEETMKSAAPELFASQPDLLHQLVTIMNPNILMNAGVPVYRTDQHAGEFIVTFPRAYHAGFNQGYNFAEAVNFAPADWMKMGRECIKHYSTLRRFCVFSHDELVCKMALEPDKLNLGIATACYLDMAEMVDSEKKLRKSLLEWGVTKAERAAFELIPDDERQCESCKTTVFLSAVTCSCTNLLVCLRHYTELCKCPAEKHTLKYRYTLDELPLMLKKLKVKAESFENWLSKVRDVLDPSKNTTITLEELQELAQEAEDKKFPSSVLLERLNAAVLEAEKCVTVIQQLDINKMRTRTRNTSDAAKYKLTLDELELFVQEIDNLYCIIQEGQSVRELQALGKEFLQSAKQLLGESLRKIDEEAVEKLIEEGSTLCIELPEIKALKTRLLQVNWYNRVREFRDTDEKIPLAEIQNFLQEGLLITPDSTLEKELYELQEMLMAVEDLEVVAKRCLENETPCDLSEIELILQRANDLEGELPSRQALKDAAKKAKDWLHTVESLQSNESYPYFHTLENLVSRGKNIPFQLEELKRMEEHLTSARTWKERTARTFLKECTTLTLLEVLSPRSEAIMYATKAKKKSMEEQFNEEMSLAQMVNAFKNAEEKEIADMKALRKQNTDKSPLDDKYCKCKRKFQGLMYQCQLCKDWFHESCVPPPKNTVRPRPNNTSSPTNSLNVPQLTARERDREPKYLCQSCMRSRRPRLETILSLLVSLQRLPIRLPEGEALQCLTERAMNWQDRVRQAFASEEVVSALALLSSISQKNNSTAGILSGAATTTTTATTTTPTTIVDKDTRTTKRRSQQMSPRQQQPMAHQQQPSDDEDDDDEADISSEDETSPRGSAATAGNMSPSSPSMTMFSKIEHAYSVPVPPTVPSSPGHGPAANSDSRTSATAPNKNEMTLIVLSKGTKETLESLMMEGDLMEVSLDETLHIWRIMNAAKPAISDLAYIHHKYKISTGASNDNLVTNNNSNKKKRRSDDNSGPPMTKRSTKGQSAGSGQVGATAAAAAATPTNSTSLSSPVTALAGSQNQNNGTATPTTTTTATSTSSSASKIKRGRKMKLTRGGGGKDNDTSASNTPTLGSSGTPGGGATEPPKKRKRGKKTTTGRQEQLAAAAAATAVAASTSDDDEECSAADCGRPTGREVDWVQCDGGCNKWFHMYCVGLDKHQLKPDEDFICKRCKKSQNANDSVAKAAQQSSPASVAISSEPTCADTDSIAAQAAASSVGNSIGSSTGGNGIAGGGGSGGSSSSSGGGGNKGGGGGRQKSSTAPTTTTTSSGSSVVLNSSSSPASSSSSSTFSSKPNNHSTMISCSSGNMISSTISSCSSTYTKNNSSICSSNKIDNNNSKYDCDQQRTSSSTKTGRYNGNSGAEDDNNDDEDDNDDYNDDDDDEDDDDDMKESELSEMELDMEPTKCTTKTNSPSSTLSPTTTTSSSVRCSDATKSSSTATTPTTTTSIATTTTTTTAAATTPTATSTTLALTATTSSTAIDSSSSSSCSRSDAGAVVASATNVDNLVTAPSVATTTTTTTTTTSKAVS